MRSGFLNNPNPPRMGRFQSENVRGSEAKQKREEVIPRGQYQEEEKKQMSAIDLLRSRTRPVDESFIQSTSMPSGGIQMSNQNQRAG